MSRRSHWRFFLLRWHRRLGVATALFVLALVVSGVLLNHSHALGLDKQPLHGSLWRRIYGLPAAPPAQGYRVGVHYLSSREGKLYLDDKLLADCERLLGTIEKSGQILAVCPRLLVLLTKDGQMIDEADTLRGVPPGLSSVSKRGDTVVLATGGSQFSVDLNDLSVHSLSVGTGLGQAETVPEPVALPESLQGAVLAPELTRERLLQDIHSGRILGRFGPLLVDAMAGLFAVLAISGLVLSRRRRHSVL